MSNESERYRIKLQAYGIVFDESVYEKANTEIQLPSTVDALREKLLDFKHIEIDEVDPSSLEGFPRDTASLIYFGGDQYANPNSISSDDRSKKHTENFLAAVRIVRTARKKARTKNVSERRYDAFLEASVLCNWDKHADDDNINPAKDQMDRIAYGQSSRLFSDAHKARHELRSKFPILDGAKPYQPKPDWFFGFPISNDYDSEDRSGLSKNNELFSLAQLAYLQQRIQLCSCPLTDVGSFVDKYGGKKNWEEDKQLSDEALLCFPWAIIEVKKPDAPPADIMECYCQAANGASSCLTMLEQLTKHNGTRHTSDSVKPIVVFTFHMRCIWEGSLITLLDTVQLRRILDCALFWALRSFRPWLLGNMDRSYGLARADEVAQVSSPSKFNLIDSKSPATIARKHALSIQGENKNGRTQDGGKAPTRNPFDRLAFDDLTLNTKQDIGENTKNQSCITPSDVPASSSLFSGVSPFKGTGSVGFGPVTKLRPVFGGTGPSKGTGSVGFGPVVKLRPVFGGTGPSTKSPNRSIFGTPRANASSGFSLGLGSTSSNHSSSVFGSTSSNHSSSLFESTPSNHSSSLFGSTSSNHSSSLFGSSLTPGDTVVRRPASTGADTSRKTFRPRDTSAPPTKRQDEIKSASSTKFTSSTGHSKKSSSSTSRNTNTSRYTSSYRGKKYQDEDEDSSEDSSDESSSASRNTNTSRYTSSNRGKKHQDEDEDSSDEPSKEPRKESRKKSRKRPITFFDLGYNYRC